MSSAPALAQIKKCEQLRDEIALRLPWPKASFRLEIVPKQEPTEGKFLGQCEAGTRKIVAVRVGDAPRERPAANPDEPGAAAPGTATPAAVKAPAVTPPPPTAVAQPAAAQANPPAPQADPPAAPMAAQQHAPAPAVPAVPGGGAAPAAESPAVVVARVDASQLKREPRIVMPELVNINDTATIEVTFELDESVQALRDSLAGGSGSGATPQRLGAERIEARLKSTKGVTVTPDEPLPQMVIKGMPATWTWFVTPESTGKLNLDIMLTVTMANGQQASYPVTLYRTVRSVVVERTTWQAVDEFMSKNWQWLATTILLPVAGLFWRSRRKQAEATAAGA